MTKTCEYINFDRIITLRTPSEARGDFGEVITTWTDVDIPAAIQYRSGVENMSQSGKEYAVTTVIFTIRYRTGLAEKQQITFENNEYDIVGIAEVPRRKYTKITAQLKR